MGIIEDGPKASLGHVSSNMPIGADNIGKTLIV